MRFENDDAEAASRERARGRETVRPRPDHGEVRRARQAGDYSHERTGARATGFGAPAAPDP
jgi:hypothetical protein